MVNSVVDRTNHLTQYYNIKQKQQRKTKVDHDNNYTYLRFPTSIGASPNGSRLRELLLLNELMSSMWYDPSLESTDYDWQHTFEMSTRKLKYVYLKWISRIPPQNYESSHQREKLMRKTMVAPIILLAVLLLSTINAFTSPISFQCVGGGVDIPRQASSLTLLQSSSDTLNEDRLKIVVVGGGWAGYSVCESLSTNDNVDIILLDAASKQAKGGLVEAGENTTCSHVTCACMIFYDYSLLICIL